MGSTGSGFPTTDGAYNRIANGFDVFVTKLNSSGNGLIYSTFIGGSSTEYGGGMAIDGNKNVYITGETWSEDFPTTEDAFQIILMSPGRTDAFITKLNASGSALEYSTYIGGSHSEGGHGISVDDSGNVYVVGSTGGTDFPTTHDAFDREFNGDRDVFIVKLNIPGNTLDYSTYLGGSSADLGYNILYDKEGNAYVSGYTESSNFPMTDNAHRNHFAGGTYDSFFLKLNKLGNSIVYSTYIGGISDDYADGMTFDTIGNVYLVGCTTSSDFPITEEVFDRYYNGKCEGFILKFDNYENKLVYSTLMGGSNGVSFYGICIDKDETLYIAGHTSSVDFITTEGAYDVTHNGGSDLFVFKFSLGTVGVRQTFDIPGEFILIPPYPNPFNPATTISYTLPKSSNVRLTIYNINGQEITSLVSDYKDAGYYEITWNASDYASGVYFCRLEAGEIVKTVKMLLLR